MSPDPPATGAKGQGRTRLAPSFRGLRSTSDAASRVGRGNKKRGTRPEMLLRKALWRMGYRYRLHNTTLPGTPDIVFPRQKVAVFCDGDFWHGRRWAERKSKLAEGANASYWVAKIQRNRSRDREVSRALRQLGWNVVRIWESDVRRDPERAARRVAQRAGLPPR